MTWYIFALISAFLVAIVTLIEKKTLQGEHAMEFSTILMLVVGFLSLPFFFMVDYSRLQIAPLVILFFNAIIWAAAILYTAKGMRHLEVSESSPLYVIAPALTAVLAVIFLREHLTLPQTAGLGLLVVGAYLLELRSRDIFEPFRVMKNSRYIHYVLLSVILLSITALIDRVLLSRYDMQPETYMAFMQLFTALAFFAMYSYNYGNIKTLNNGFKQYGLPILIMAALTVGYRYAQAESTKLAYIGLVIAIKRSSTLFITIIGGRLFNEKNLIIKTLACLVMIGGVILIMLT